MANHSDQQDLPEIVQQYIKRLARRVVNRHMRRDVLAELRDHFADALAEAPGDCDRDELAVSLIADFGDTKSLSKLIKRAKKRCRPMWVKFVIRTCQTVLVLLVIFAAYTAWFVTGKPTIRVDYLAKFNEFSRPTADESLNAAPHYLKAIELYIEPPEIEFERVQKKTDFGIPEGSPPPPGGHPPGFFAQTVERVITLEDIVKNPGTPLESNERQALQAWLQTNLPGLEELRLGTSKPHCWFKYKTGQRDGRPGPLLSLLLPSLQGLRHTGLLLIWQMQFAAGKGDWDSVIADLRSGKTLAKRIMNCPFLIEQLIGTAIDQRANQQLILILQGHTLPVKAHQDLALILAESFPSGYPIADVGRESVFLLDTVQRVFTDDGSGDGHLIPFALERFMSASGSVDRSDGPLDLVMAVVHSSRRETVQIIEQWKQMIDRYRSATPYQNYISGQPVDAWILKIIEENPRNFFIRNFLPATQRAVWISYAGQAQHQAAATVVALLRYKADHGQFPDTLEKLVPQYLKAVPQDPFGPGPLTYKRQAADFLLYSLSFNFEDDGGQHDQDAFGRGTPDADYVFWPSPPVERPN